MYKKYVLSEYEGSQINSWLILGFSHIDDKKQQYWMCRCNCGREVPVRATHVVRELSKGCRFCRGQATGGSASPYWKGGDFISGSVFTVIKLSAKARGIPFDLGIPHLEAVWNLQEGKCFYTGAHLTLPTDSRGGKSGNASVDRKDSSIGYVDGNVQWVTKEINIMKMALPEARFIELCKQVSWWKGGSCGI